MSTQQKLDLVSSLLKEIKDEIGNDISKIESKNLAFYCQMVKKNRL